MTRLLTNSSLLSKMGECNIYYINKYIYILYLGLKNTTSNNRNFISNKKIYTLIFWSGNSGNSGNKPNKPLKLQQSLVPTFSVFNSHYSHFPFCQTNLVHCFLRIFLENLRCRVKSYSELKFEESVFLAYSAWRRFLTFATLNWFFANFNKPPGSIRNEYFFIFLYFFLKEIKND